MKKKVLCVFSLILYLLVACTLLSQKIETEMLTLAEVSAVNTKAPNEPTTRELPPRMMFADEQGEHAYEVIVGSGWEDGLRIKEVDSWAYNIYGAISIPGYPTSRYVLSATRQPQTGELVAIIEKMETGDDQYLAIYPQGVPEEVTLPSSAEIATQSGDAMLFNMTGVTAPFMEHTAKGLSETMGYASRIFSLTEVEAMLEQLPLLALLAVLVLIPVLLWVASCCFASDPQANQGALLGNGVLALASLFGTFLVLRKIDLPASLLPVSNILDVGHYMGEFSLVFQALESLGTARDLLVLAQRMRTVCLMILLAGMLLTAIVIAAQCVILRRKTRA